MLIARALRRQAAKRGGGASGGELIAGRMSISFFCAHAERFSAARVLLFCCLACVRRRRMNHAVKWMSKVAV